MGRAAAAARAPNLGSPARVPSSDLLPAPGVLLRSALVEAAGRAVAVAQAPREDNEEEAGGSSLALVLNPRAPVGTARSAAIKAAVKHEQTALAAPGAVEVSEGVEVVAVHVVAVAGVNTKGQYGDLAQEWRSTKCTGTQRTQFILSLRL